MKKKKNSLTMEDYIDRVLKDLREAVCRDGYNLTRDDHDAILVKVQDLREFIEGRYEQHGIVSR